MQGLFKNIKLLNAHTIENKRVVLRVDFNVTLTVEKTIADPIRISKTVPTIELLLKHNNKVILVSHFDRPEKRDSKYSLKPVADYLQSVFSNKKVVLVDDFLSQKGKEQLVNQTANEIILLENIRFYKGEQANDTAFAKQLAALGDVYINDAFGVSHRNETSIVGIPQLLPSYCGLLLEKEIDAVAKITHNPKQPVVAIIGGAKISTKIIFLSKLIHFVNYLLLGGGIANTFLLAKGHEIGQSLAEKDHVKEAQDIFRLAKEKNVALLLPTDFVGLEENLEKTYSLNEFSQNFSILDIGPKTKVAFSTVVNKARTIIWNGPVGYFEDPRFAKGTDFIFEAIVQNKEAFSVIGGGDTLAAVAKKEDIKNIGHISTGGGALLELIENGTLPGIEALRTWN